MRHRTVARLPLCSAALTSPTSSTSTPTNGWRARARSRRTCREHMVGENIHRYPMSLTSLECLVSGLVDSDTCPRPTTHRILAALRFGELLTREAFHGLDADVAARSHQSLRALRLCCGA